MANFSFSLRLALGLLPKTEKIENQYNQLVEEYNRLIEYRESDELKEFLELEKYINSLEFKSFKNNLMALNFQNSDSYQKEKRYLNLKKSNLIVNYFKVLNSPELKRFNEIMASDPLARYQELSQYLVSEKHKSAKSKIEAEYLQEAQKQNDYLKQKKSSAFKAYFKIKNSALLANYNALKESNELSDYQELAAYIQTEEFIQLKQQPEFKKSEEAAKEKQFVQLKKSKKFVSYFKFSQSAAFSQFQQFSASQELSDYLELELYVLAADYTKNLESLKYSNSEEFLLEKEFEKLKNDQNIKFWEKYQQSKSYKLYTETEGSEILNEYNTLEELINSEEFRTNKAYLLDKNKFDKTEEASKEKKYLEMKQSQNIKWFNSVDKSAKFDSLKTWKITFEDNFDQPKVDENKWMNSFFWGKMLINDRYVMAGDKQYYSDNKNFEINQSVLKIVTRKEKAKGKVWHPVHGFNQQDFEYTSGMLSTAHSFRQQYGRFEAKIKVNPEFPVYQAFWLKGEQIVPQIDIFKFNMDKPGLMQLSVFNKNEKDAKKPQKNTSKLGGMALAKDYYIYSIDWTADKVTWKINGVEVFTSSQPIPNEPMYLMLSTGMRKEAKTLEQPAAFEVDWVRCYEKAEN
jgi:beta-glucanase (GH16 family)